MLNEEFLKKDLVHSDMLRRLLPRGIKRFVKSRIPYADYRSEQLKRDAERRFAGPVPAESDYDSPYPVELGILFDNSYTYAFNVAACRELKVRYRVIDVMRDDWVKQIGDAACSAFLASPPTLLSVWRNIFDERLWVMANDMKIRLCPSYQELYLWESKRRMHNWLSAHGVAHPETRVFLDREAALEFCRVTAFPMVCKTDSGASSSGVFVLRDRRSAERLVKQAFGAGILPKAADSRERAYGYILFQRYISHDYEWRIVRIGDIFLCRRKVRAGDFASGSGSIGWAGPPSGMLDFVRRLTDAGSFRSMAVDLFETPDPRSGPPYFVNELQAIFGAIEKEANTNEHTGCWRFDETSGRWRFTPGFYYQNACSNLRVRMLLNDFNCPLPPIDTTD